MLLCYRAHAWIGDLDIIKGVRDQDRFAAWMVAITTWYGLAGTSQTKINHYHNRSLRLGGFTEASQYVNNFIICPEKLGIQKL